MKEKNISHNMKNGVIVIGHRNPDTDSICAAIAYSDLKNHIDKSGRKYIPCRAGSINRETKFVLEHFEIAEPTLVETVETQLSDVEYRKTKGISRDLSLKDAWTIMNENEIVTLPAVTDQKRLEGLITMSDIAKSYMNIYDSEVISKAGTKYRNIAKTLEAEIITGDIDKRCNEGKVLIAAANPEMMSNYIEEHDIVILGNRAESQLSALDNGADCIIICEGADVSPNIKKLASTNGMIIMTTNYDAYTAARLINQSMPISYFMKRKGFITFTEEDSVEDIKDVMTANRHRDFPVLDKDGKYLGLVSRRNLLGSHGKSVILVDHNEAGQAVKGIDNANILEIIDHHRLGTIQTMSPVYFRNQPLGCTSTIIYHMYKENGVVPNKSIAGLLLSAIISDTLMFRSPTSTIVDREVATELSKIADVDIEKFAISMFSAASDLKGKSDQDIFYQDYKRFAAGNVSFGVSQITSLNENELNDIKEGLSDFAIKIVEDSDMDMVFIMLTNILREDSILISVGPDSLKLARAAFPGIDSEKLSDRENVNILRIPGLVSRKKQLVPKLTLFAEQA